MSGGPEQAADDQEAEMLNETTANLKELLGCTGTVYTAANHVLVDDGATRAIYSQDQAQKLAEEWQANIEKSESVDDEDGYEKGQAYSLACSATCAMHANEVPDEVAEALCEESGLDLDNLTYGW